MKTRINLGVTLGMMFPLISATWIIAQQPGAGAHVAPSRPEAPCDIYAAAGDPCVAAHSTTRALYASYNGPLYRVLRQSDGKTLDIGVGASAIMASITPGRKLRTGIDCSVSSSGISSRSAGRL